MVIHTETGSIYEINEKEKKIRRITGEGNPTERVGKDGSWKDYLNIDILDTMSGDKQMLIIWKIEDGVARSTLTSIIVKMEKEISKA